MKTKAAPRRKGAQVVECVDALHEHCARAGAIAALLELCGEADAGAVDLEAVGKAAWLIGRELEALRGCARRLEEARR